VFGSVTSAPDVFGNVGISDHNLIGNSQGFSATKSSGDMLNPSFVGLDPKGLQNNGGPTQTLALLPGSQAIDKGDSNVTGLPSTDQRGFGFARTRGAAVDIGAYETQGFDLVVTGGNLQTGQPTDAFAAPLVVTVVAADGVDPVAGGQVTFTAPSSGATASFSPHKPLTIAAHGTATANATANYLDGSYNVTVNTVGAVAPVTISLTNASPLETGLINQINAAQAAGGATTITLPANTTYDFTFAGDPIFGDNALPVITGNITIIGNGDTIERTGPIPFRLFDVAPGGSLTLENLTLTGGLAQGTGTAAEGGAIYSSGTLSLSGVKVKSNRAVGSAGANATALSPIVGPGASAYGGGVYANGGAVTLTNDTSFSGNTALGGRGGNTSDLAENVTGGAGGAGSGGGLYVAAGTVTLSNDILSGNNAK